MSITSKRTAVQYFRFGISLFSWQVCTELSRGPDLAVPPAVLHGIQSLWKKRRKNSEIHLTAYQLVGTLAP